MQRILSLTSRIAAFVVAGAVLAASAQAITLMMLRNDRIDTALVAATTFDKGIFRPQDGRLTAFSDYQIYNASGQLIAARDGKGRADIEPLEGTSLAGHRRALDTGQVVVDGGPSLIDQFIAFSPPEPVTLFARISGAGTGLGTVRMVLVPNEAGRMLASAVNGLTFIALVVLAGALVLFAKMSQGQRHGRHPAGNANPHVDPLTRLPTRMTFLNVLNAIADKARSQEGQLSVLVINLDRFKFVNDRWTHKAGDVVLRETINRIRPLVGEKAMIGRLSADEFGVVIAGEANPRGMKQVGKQIIDALSQPFQVGKVPVSLTASVGISLFPVNAENGNDLFRAADLALMKAKSDGGNCLRFFDTALEQHLSKRNKLEHDLRLALKNEEFVVFYQPQLNLSKDELCGYEALIRWERPGLGIVSPMEFIPIAEETGLIKPLGEWILRKACEDAANWIEKGTIAVNFSPAQFQFPGLVESIETALKDTGLDPQRLEVEITESLFLNHSPEVMDMLHQIKALGVRIAMDDFGTGYSSLSYLAKFPFDKIKIDRSFVSQLADDPQIGAIISSIVGLGRSLSVDITAEGVETQDQVALLRAAGCSIVQGFLFGAPQRASQSLASGQDAKTRSA